MNPLNNFYKFTAAASEGEHARLDLFGEVGGGFWSQGFDETTFGAEMSAIPEDAALDVYINSPGGSVFTAMAIRSMLGRHKGKVTIIVAGMAASAATLITCAKNAHVVMQKGSMMLVHPVRLDAGSLTANEMREAAETLDKVSQSVRDIYAERTGMDEQGLDMLMNKESYLTASEAVSLGFADEVDNKKEVKNCIRGDVAFVGNSRFSASLFANAPRDFISRVQEENIMNLEQLRADHPELVEEIKAQAAKEAVEAERARIKAIDDLTLSGQADFAMSAKFDKPMSAADFSIEMIKRVKEAEAAAAERKVQMLRDIEADANVLADTASTGNTGFVGENKQDDKSARLDSALDAVMKQRANRR